MLSLILVDQARSSSPAHYNGLSIFGEGALKNLSMIADDDQTR